MEMEVFKELCRGISGYDAVIIGPCNVPYTNVLVFMRYVYTPKSILYEQTLVGSPSDPFGFSTTKYDVPLDSRVLVLTEKEFTALMMSKRIRLHSCVKDFK